MQCRDQRLAASANRSHRVASNLDEPQHSFEGRDASSDFAPRDGGTLTIVVGDRIMAGDDVARQSG